jgi:hypothetical protein
MQTDVVQDGRPGAACIQAGSTKVAFADEAGLVHEVELIADPDVLATMDIVRVRTKSRGGHAPDHAGIPNQQSDK